MRYFPDPDTAALQPFTQAFVRLMFAHADFERRVSELMGIITCDPAFGEQPKNSRWSAKDRPKKIKKLIAEHQSKHIDGIPEQNDIAACLCRAIAPCNERNMLAHGSWWAFDIDAGTITVRAGIDWPNEEQHRDFTEAEIKRAVTLFDELEGELYQLQRMIERRTGRLTL